MEVIGGREGGRRGELFAWPCFREIAVEYIFSSIVTDASLPVQASEHAWQVSYNS